MRIHRVRGILSAAWALGVALVIFGCGGGGGSSATATGLTATATGSSTGTATASGTATSTSTSTGGNPSFAVTYVVNPASVGTSNTLYFQSGFGTPKTLGTGTLFKGPALSPDKSRIVVSQGSGSAGDLFLYNTSGSGSPVQLTQTNDVVTAAAFGNNFQWNAQGTKILFQRQGGSLWTISPTGGTLTEVAPTATDNQPNWSPDGSKLCFDSGNTLVVCAADGSNPQVVYTLPPNPNPGSTTGYAFAGHTWSHDSSVVYFATNDQTDPNVPNLTTYIYSVHATSGQTAMLVSTLAAAPADAGAPLVSPGGSLLAYLNQGSVNVMNLDGTSQTSVDTGFDWRWTGANQLVLFNGNYNLYLAAPTAGAAETPIFTAPSGQFIAYFDAR